MNHKEQLVVEIYSEAFALISMNILDYFKTIIIKDFMEGKAHSIAILEVQSKSFWFQLFVSLSFSSISYFSLFELS
jgi:hypothetical protein